MASFLFRLGRGAALLTLVAALVRPAAAQGPDESPDFPPPPRVLPVSAEELPTGNVVVPSEGYSGQAVPTGLVPAIDPVPTTYGPMTYPEDATLFPPLPATARSMATLTDPPKYPTVRLTGFFHLDFLTASQDTRNRFTVGDVSDGLDFRRARIGAVGNVAEDIAYRFELDFAASQPLFVDLWAEFHRVPVVGNVRVGRFRQPFGMTELTGVRELPFLERETMFTLSPFRQTGVMAFDTAFDERATYAVSGYRYNTDPLGNVFADAGGYGLAARFTGLPYYEGDSRLVHLGADYSYNRPGGTNPIRFQSGPEVYAGIRADDANVLPPLVDTGRLQVDDLNSFNLEFAAVRDNFLVQSEARAVVVTEANGNRATLPAYYLTTRYVLTGESIPYDRKAAVFGRVRPDRPVGQGGLGAWELAARWSSIDLNGTDGPGPGRRTHDLTLGVNWYLVDNAKFQFNYIHPILNDQVLGTSNSDFFAVRCQIDF